VLLGADRPLVPDGRPADAAWLPAEGPRLARERWGGGAGPRRRDSTARAAAARPAGRGRLAAGTALLPDHRRSLRARDCGCRRSSRLVTIERSHRRPGSQPGPALPPRSRWSGPRRGRTPHRTRVAAVTLRALVAVPVGSPATARRWIHRSSPPAALSLSAIASPAPWGRCWTLPTTFLSGPAAAGGIALINLALGQLWPASRVAYLVGLVKDAHRRYAGASAAPFTLSCWRGAALALAPATRARPTPLRRISSPRARARRPPCLRRLLVGERDLISTDSVTPARRTRARPASPRTAPSAQ